MNRQVTNSYWFPMLVDSPLYDDAGRVLLFRTEGEALAAGAAEWGCPEYVGAYEARLTEDGQESENGS